MRIVMSASLRWSVATMLLVIVIIVLLVNRRRWYGQGPYWAYTHYRAHGPYGPADYGYVWNGYAWQPNYSSIYGPNYAPYYGYPYGYCRRPYIW